MTGLFTPLTLRSVTFAHRAWMSPMMQFAAVPAGPDEGSPTDWHTQHLGSRAVAGAALVMVEATAVHPVGRSSVFDLGLWNDRQADGLRRIAEFVTAQGSVPGIQIVHAGRKGSTGRPWGVDDQRWPTVGPSAVPFGRLPTPAELGIDEIAEITTAFADAAGRAARAGFKVLEIHGAHGYLIHQFLSPQSNRRSDGYGGSPENRMRFAWRWSAPCARRGRPSYRCSSGFRRPIGSAATPRTHVRGGRWRRPSRSPRGCRRWAST